MNGFVSPFPILVTRADKQNGWRRTLSSDHVCDLNDGVDVRLREDTLTASTLYVETQDSERRRFRPLVIRCVRDEVTPSKHIVK